MCILLLLQQLERLIKINSYQDFIQSDTAINTGFGFQFHLQSATKKTTLCTQRVSRFSADDRTQLILYHMDSKYQGQSYKTYLVS